jgi:hypothetical protein
LYEDKEEIIHENYQEILVAKFRVRLCNGLKVVNSSKREGDRCACAAAEQRREHAFVKKIKNKKSVKTCSQASRHVHRLVAYIFMSDT